MYALMRAPTRNAGGLMYSQELWKNWGQWFAAERKARNVTQQEAADKAGIQRPHLSVIERGQSGAKRDTIIALAQAIGADPDEALRRAGFAADSPPPMPHGSFLMDVRPNGEVAYIGDLTEESKDMLKKLLEILPKREYPPECK